MLRTLIGGLLVAGLAGLAGWVAGCAVGPSAVSSEEGQDAMQATTAMENGVRYYPQPGDASALAELIAYGSRQQTKLPPDYLLLRLQEREATPAIATAFARVEADDTPAQRAALIRAIELDYVHRADTSSLDLLGLELSERFQAFDWEANDYPGGDEGPNEMYAGTLADALDGVTPERRANRAAVAVIVRDEVTEALWEYMLAQWRPVPGENEKQLNRHAVGAYLAMREAAAADGVDLTILSGHRDPRRARENAARVGNSFAVASFSSHSLGLAIDFELPKPSGDTAAVAVDPEDAADITQAAGLDPADASKDAAEAGGRFRLTTRPMSAVVDMRRSPVHKWLHLYGRAYGWYPFQHEPWHWEYNPPGFRDVFFHDYPGEVPPRPADELAALRTTRSPRP